MKVSELIEELKKMNQDAVIITAADEEGNSFRLVPMGWVTPGSFIKGRHNDGEFHANDDDGYEEEKEEGQPSVCIGQEKIMALAIGIVVGGVAMLALIAYLSRLDGDE